jgi:acylphosphatase
MQSERRKIVVSGRVQGVGFRYAAVRAAERLELRGWVCNRADGKVEITAEGAPEAVRELIAWCHEGPRGARVTAVEDWPLEAGEPLSGFTVRR